MAVTRVAPNNSEVVWSKQLLIEANRKNLFEPYVGSNLTSIIRRVMDLTKNAGEQINIPLVEQLEEDAVGVGSLVGNEDQIDNYGFRLWIDWARKAVLTKRSEEQKTSMDMLETARPLLSNWQANLQRNEYIQALHSIPTNAVPRNLGSGVGQRVNGILYSQATTAEKNKWNTNNADRVLYGVANGNYNSVHATALANIDNTNDKLTKEVLSLAKRLAMNASPRITPYMTDNAYEGWVLFTGTRGFRDLRASLETLNLYGRPREGDSYKDNPIFSDGDLLYDKIIIKEIPEMDRNVVAGRDPNTGTIVAGAGAGGIDVAASFLVGQSALAIAWAQPPRPTRRDETDYQFLKGVGTDMAYGIGKIAKNPAGIIDPTILKDWGVFTIYHAAVADA